MAKKNNTETEAAFFSKVTFEPHEIYIPSDKDNPNDFFFSASYLMSLMWYPGKEETENRRFCTAFTFTDWLARYNKHISKPNIDIGVIDALLTKMPLPLYDPWYFACESLPVVLIISSYYAAHVMKHKEPSLKKSKIAAYNICKKAKILTSMSKTKEVSIDEINKRWEVYKPVSHLLLATFNAFIKNRDNIPGHLVDNFAWFSVLFTPNTFTETLAFSETIRKFAEAYLPPRVNSRLNKPILIPGETWAPSPSQKIEPVQINCEKFYTDFKKWITTRIK